MIVKEQVNIEKLRALEEKLGCTFGEEGKYAEMSLSVADYQEKTAPIENATFGFFEGNEEELLAVVAAVDKEWCQYLKGNPNVFCGFLDGKLVSFLSAKPNADCILSLPDLQIGSIGCVGTVPEFRGKGIALRMVDLATVWLKEQGCDKVYVNYTPIEHWYAKLGYQTFARFSR